MNKDEFKTALVDVRRAYRLLYGYQRRVLDIVKYIAQKLSLHFEGGRSQFSNHAKEGKAVNLCCWAWDWLPFYVYEFRFAENNGVIFSIILQSDSGYYESDVSDYEDSDYDEGRWRLDVANFTSPEDSSTRLYFAATKGFSEKQRKDFLVEKEEDNFANNDPVYKEMQKNKKGLLKPYCLTEFLNEESTIKVIYDFLKCSEEKGMKICDDNIKNQIRSEIYVLASI